MDKGTITWFSASEHTPDIDKEESKLLDMQVSVRVLIAYKDYPITTGNYYPNSDHWVLHNLRGKIEVNRLCFAYINYPESIKL